MSTMILIDSAGPLPLKATFESPVDGPVTFVLSGTAWTQQAPVLTGIGLLLDGAEIGSSAVCFANQNALHLAMRTTYITFDNLTIGQHSVTIQTANSQTVTDFNDYFQVTLLY